MDDTRNPGAVAAIDQGTAHVRDYFDKHGVCLADPDQLKAVSTAVVLCSRMRDRAAFLGLLSCLHEMGEQ